VVLAELLELAPGGLEEMALDDGLVEYAIYGAPGELPNLGRLHAAAGGSLVEVITEEVPEGWETRWREFHRPVRVGGTLTIRPPWAPTSDTRTEVVIDPGQAFGTGAHPTTRLCLELLLELTPSGPLVDLGCGSGVVAIASAILGYDPVLALDNDPAAIQAARENARLNAAQVDIRRHDLRTDRVQVAETTVANLLAPLLLSWAARLGDADELPRRLVVGGLLRSEAAAVSEAFSVHGLRELSQRHSGDWAALLLASDT
jgi:ribosomal protein L11 methyltransferase